eukprot:TRINITY_DN80764_c0_g1_i1.p1 TRINITY_DN80764_c0_g1~~TRINITY_DN80764_c0_g1_i1.p1  ORF type:complete len:717 (-),score=126.87 TRINITY_DN80764_c0_g1_i1:503-2653(-)
MEDFAEQAATTTRSSITAMMDAMDTAMKAATAFAAETADAVQATVAAAGSKESDSEASDDEESDGRPWSRAERAYQRARLKKTMMARMSSVSSEDQASVREPESEADPPKEDGGEELRAKYRHVHERLSNSDVVLTTADSLPGGNLQDEAADAWLGGLWKRPVSMTLEAPHTACADGQEEELKTGLAAFVRKRRAEIIAGSNHEGYGRANSMPLVSGPPTPPVVSPREARVFDMTIDDDDIVSSVRRSSLNSADSRRGHAATNPELASLFRGYVRDKLSGCLLELRDLPVARSFLTIPWQDSSLTAVLDNIDDLVDLRVIDQRLRDGLYQAASGEMKPEVFWADVEKCWNDCKTCHAVAKHNRELRQAQEMKVMIEAISEEFWEEMIEADPDLRPDDGELPQDVCRAMFHCWSHDRLRYCVAALKQAPEAKLFLSPFPWKELGLSDYPQIVLDPMDLGTVSRRLERGKYRSEGGGVDAKLFWADITRCWINCKRYFEPDEEEESVASCQLADSMQMIAEELEGKYWAEVRDMRAAMGKQGMEVEQGSPTAGAGALARSTPLEPRQSSMSADGGRGEQKNSARSAAEDASLKQLRLATEQQAEEDRIIHNWCRKQLRLCLQTLSQQPEAQAVQPAAAGSCESVISLQVFSERLNTGAYEDEFKLTDPELFWADVCVWAEAGSPALAAPVTELESKFWRALDRFEKSIGEAESDLSVL